MVIRLAIFRCVLVEHTLLGLTLQIQQDTELNSKVISPFNPVEDEDERAQGSRTWILGLDIPEFESRPCCFTVAV